MPWSAAYHHTNISEIVVKNVKNIPQRIIYYKTIRLEVCSHKHRMLHTIYVAVVTRGNCHYYHFHFYSTLSQFIRACGGDKTTEEEKKSPFKSTLPFDIHCRSYKWVRTFGMLKAKIEQKHTYCKQWLHKSIKQSHPKLSANKNETEWMVGRIICLY